MARTQRIPKNPAFYARISQDRTGLSVGVNDQIEEGRRHLAEQDWPEPAIYQDNDISARSRKTRPGFERLIADIEAGVVDGLAARHLDRLLRRVTDLERVLDAIEDHRHPVPVLLVHGSEIDLSSASGRLLARILASVAANESEIKGERVGDARRREAQAGRAHGFLGYGYDVDQHLVAFEVEIIREVAARVIDGQSLRSIAVDLNDRGVPTPGAERWDARRVDKCVARAERRDLVNVIELARSPEVVELAVFARLLNKVEPGEKWTAARIRDHAIGPHLAADGHGLDDSAIAEFLREARVPADPTMWRAANLRAMIRRGALCGWREFSPGKRGGSGELVAQGDWTPILTKKQTEDIRRITNRPGVRGRQPKHLLAGILRCGLCGSSMGGSPDGRGGTRYACSRQPGLHARCGGLTITGAPVDAMVSRAVIDTLADAHIRTASRRPAMAPQDVVDAQQEMAEIEADLLAYREDASRGDLKRDDYHYLRRGLEKRYRAAEQRAGAWSPSTGVVLRDVPVKRPELQTWWDTQNIARRREVIAVLIDSIPVSPSTGANRFDPSRLGAPIWNV